MQIMIDCIKIKISKIDIKVKQLNTNVNLQKINNLIIFI